MYVVVYKRASNGVSTLMAISTTGILLYAKVCPFIMHYGSALLLFTRKLHCLQTYEHMSAFWLSKPRCL